MTVGFVDSRNQVIRSITMESVNGGIIIAGNGNKSLLDNDIGTLASFWMPYSISVPPMDPAPYAIIADYGNRCIRRIELSGSFRVSTLICGGLITSPSDTAVLNNGDMYIADPISHTVLFYSNGGANGGSVMTVAGLPGHSGYQDGESLIVAKFNQPLGIAVHAFTNVLYIADWLNDAIRYMDPQTNMVGTLVRGKGFRDGIFSLTLINGPKTVRMVGAQYLAVSDSDNGAIRIMDLVNETTFTLFGNGSRAHVDGNAAIAKGSAIWGISGTCPIESY